MFSGTFSSDGRWYIACGDKGAVYRWNMSEDNPVGQKLQGAAERMLSGTFSPDGKWYVACGEAGAVYCWDTHKGSVNARKLQGAKEGMVSGTFSPDGKWYAACGEKGEAWVWDMSVEGNTRGKKLGDAGRNINSGVFRPDGKWLVTCGDKGEVYRWSVPVGGGEQAGLVGEVLWQELERPLPEVIDGEVVSGSVRVAQGNDTGYPGDEYEYAGKSSRSMNKVVGEILRGIKLKRNILLAGPVGVGKSWVVKAVYRLLRRRVETMNGHDGMVPEDLLYRRCTENDARGKVSTYYELTGVGLAMYEGRGCIFEEVNRCPVGVLAVLNHALQNREIVVPPGVEIRVPGRGEVVKGERILAKEGFSLVMTMNPPEEREGRMRVEVNEMMYDFMDRMYTIEVGYMPEDEEIEWLVKIYTENVQGSGDSRIREYIGELVRVANEKRKEAKRGIGRGVSTRTLEKVIRYVKGNAGENWLEVLGMMSGVEGAMVQGRKSVIGEGVAWEGKFPEFKNSRKRGPPEIGISEDGSRVKIGGTEFGRKDKGQKSRYFGGIEQNDYVVEQMGKQRALGEHVLLVGEAGRGKTGWRWRTGS
jgi:MoxR-like ATPase